MTGADPALFAELEGRADLLHVHSGRLGPATLVRTHS